MSISGLFLPQQYFLIAKVIVSAIYDSLLTAFVLVPSRASQASPNPSIQFDPEHVGKFGQMS